MINANALLTEKYDKNPFVTFDSSGIGKSRIFDDTWDFTALKQNRKKVVFTGISKKHRSNAQIYFYEYLTFLKRNRNDEHISVGTLYKYACSMSFFIKATGISELSLLSQEHIWRRLKSQLSGLFSKTTFRGYITFFNQMNAAGLIDRYVTISEFSGHFFHSDPDPQQHIALPLSMHIKSLEKTYETIEKYHPWRTQISEVMGKVIAYRDEIYAENPNLSNKTLSSRVIRFANKLNKIVNIPDFRYHAKGKWIHDILKDCLICIAMFSGARKEELLSLSIDSYSELNGISIIKGLTSKGNQGQPIQTTWNTHPIAKTALELAYDSSNFARDIYKHNIQEHFKNGDIDKDKHDVSMQEVSRAFISLDMGMRTYEAVKLDYSLNLTGGLGAERFNFEATSDDVEEFDLLNPSRCGELEVGGSLKKFSLHDFRRSFAVFMIRHQLGGLLTIKYQFKHKNLQMSGWYANYADLARTEGILMDEELMNLCDIAMEDAAVDALDDIYNLSPHLSGAEGERIFKAKAEKLEKGEQIYLTRDELRQMVRLGEKSVVILPTGGYCTSPDCERLCSLTVISKKKKGCGAVLTDSQARRKLKEHSALVRSFRGMNELNDYAYIKLLEGHKNKIKSIEEKLLAHKIDFEPFTDEVSINLINTKEVV